MDKRKKRQKSFMSAKRILGILKKEKSAEDYQDREYVQIPNFFPKDMSREERLKAVKEGAEKARSEFDKRYEALQEWTKKYDAIYILSFLAYYYLSYPEGQDPEVTGQLAFPPYYVEVLQAIALCKPRSYSMDPLSAAADQLAKELDELNNLFQLSLFTFLRGDITPEDLAAHEIRGDMVLQTLAVRNWAYPHQMLRIVRDLAERIDKRNGENSPVRFLSLIDTLHLILGEVEELLNQHREKVRAFLFKTNYSEMIRAYNQVFPKNVPVNDDQIEEIWIQVGRNIEHIKGLLLFQSDLKLENVYSFSLEHFISLFKDSPNVEAVELILDKLSYSFGELAEHKKEYFLLDNPVHRRPFIKIDKNRYFSALYYILPDLLLRLLEKMIEDQPELLADYNDKIKSTYLENEVHHLFTSHFPSAAIYRGSMWLDLVTGKTFENDIIIVIDTFAIVVECKSGSISPPAKRGARLSLFDKIEELIEEPSEQATRFIKFLKENRKAHSFDTRRGQKNIIDSSKINYYVPIGVTLSSWGIVGSNLKDLVTAKIVEKEMPDLAMSISLTDLECVLDILKYEAECIHYFFRRREFDDHVNYTGDELDLLDFYLGNGFNIGEAEYDKNNSFLMVYGSKSLDPYFIGKAAGKPVSKPKHDMTKWWEDLLLVLSKRKPRNWVETSFILLNTTKSDQVKFENAVKELISRIEKGEVTKKHNWVSFASGPDQRKYMIIGYPYKTQDKEERDSVIGTIISSVDSKTIRGVVVIGININRSDYPYSNLAGKLDTNLTSF